MSETSKGANYQKSKQRRGYATVSAVDPHDGRTWDLLISPKLMEHVKSRGMGKARELADSVRWALLHPSALYRGVRDIENEIDDDDWLCYVATPPRAYDYRTGQQRPPWTGEVLLVFVNDERVVYNWIWFQSDPADPRLPIDHAVRFGEKVF